MQTFDQVAAEWFLVRHADILLMALRERKDRDSAKAATALQVWLDKRNDH